MLSRIFIQNFALIDHLEIGLQSGLQVITGETGAGKSIILGALRLIMGDRADTKTIADTSKKSIVEAEFQISDIFVSFFEENDLDFEKQSIIRREILPSGKSRAFINDVPVTLDILKKFSEQLIDIHSQFETSQLFSEAFQFKMIDGLGENNKVLAEYQASFQEFNEERKKLAVLKEQLKRGTQEADYQRFLQQELEEAQLDDFDFEELQNQLSTQENAESISENLAEVLMRFDQEQVGLLDVFSEIKHKMSKIGELSNEFLELEQRLESNFLDLKDIFFELQNKAESIEINPRLLEELLDRVNKVNALFLKHQVTNVESLIEIRDRIANEQKGFQEIESYIGETEKNLAKIGDQLEILANKLSQNRKKASPIFQKKVEEILTKLGLDKARIQAQLTGSDHFNEFGKENVQILFQANSGFPLQPIQNAVSGGERSRIMLAVKKIMAENSELPTLILDEIDTGVSGKVADEMGLLMREMAEKMQLIVITHLAQVAAKGAQHYKVIKTEDALKKTKSDIVPLNNKEKIQEIAQLLSGTTITDAALKQAKELMK